MDLPQITKHDVAKMVSDAHDKAIADMQSGNVATAAHATSMFALTSAVLGLILDAGGDPDQSANDAATVAGVAIMIANGADESAVVGDGSDGAPAVETTKARKTKKAAKK